MTNDHSLTFGQLIGTSGTSIRWSFVLSLCIALVGSGILSGALASAVGRGTHIVAMSAVGWVYLLVYPLLLAASIVAVFRVVRRDSLGALVAPFVYVAIALAADLLMSRLGENDQTLTSLLAWNCWGRFFWTFLFLFGIVIAMRWIKRWWLALPLGAAAGEVFMLAFRPLGTLLLAPPDFTVRSTFFTTLQWLPFALVEAAALAGILWVGREIATADAGRVSKRFYLASIFGGIWLGFVLTLALISPATVIVVGAGIAMIYGGVVMMVLVYRMWSAIQDGHARTTPGKALGFMFIPVFNLYWAFQVFWGFAKDYNRYIERHRLQARRLPAGLFLAYVILCLVGVIPIVQLFVVATNLFLGASMIAKICDAVNSIPLSRPSELPMAA
jgi:hypothetical protein